MSRKEIEKRLIRLRGALNSGQIIISAWDRLSPRIEQTDEQLSYVEDTLRNAPPEIDQTTSENLLDILDKAEKALSILDDIPQPPSEMVSFVNSTASATVSSYDDYVRDTKTKFVYIPVVLNWAEKTITLGQELREKYNRSDVVRSRLTEIYPDLGALHRTAVDTTLACKAGTQSAVEAASTPQPS
ncbi:MAG: hypothetical protein WA996_23105 [Candidatus Promineifilaceae bacterium]